MSKRWAWAIGASDGLGRASAERLLDDGWGVVVSARPGERLDRARRELASHGEVRSVPIDLATADLSTVARQVDDDCGGLAAAILSGGGPPPSAALDLTNATLDAAYALLLRPAAQLVAGLGPLMAQRGAGTLILLTSSGVGEPIPGLAPSNIMRAGVTSLMKTASRELAPHGVRILCVAPGRIQTSRVDSLDAAAAERRGVSVAQVRAASQDTIPMGRYGEPREFGAAVAWLCSPDASYISGTTINVDGGKAVGLLS